MCSKAARDVYRVELDELREGARFEVAAAQHTGRLPVRTLCHHRLSVDHVCVDPHAQPAPAPARLRPLPGPHEPVVEKTPP
eukprot:7680887-Pyramimonas_sp.AAC.1